MSYLEYSDELYEAFDRVRESFYYDDVIEEIKTIMWYAGLEDEFEKADKEDWTELLHKAYEILKIY